MIQEGQKTVYELSLNLLVTWQAHSLSNAGTDGSIRTYGRTQLLADGVETDAISGNISKHHHAVLLAEYFQASGIKLCLACAARDGRRAAALIDNPAYKELSLKQIITECGLCDVHGFLVTGKNGSTEKGEETRQRLSKHSLLEFSYGLGLPDHHNETIQLTTRAGGAKGEGQMLMKKPSRSGEYA